MTRPSRRGFFGFIAALFATPAVRQLEDRLPPAPEPTSAILDPNAEVLYTNTVGGLSTGTEPLNMTRSARAAEKIWAGDFVSMSPEGARRGRDGTPMGVARETVEKDEKVVCFPWWN
ncbi:MAG: hypothetical protein GY913_21495 [Proteobacteria bacterium]|nr:hypothetical protein [Actinomycetes bacterium]MCP4919484.1 hypothetical protein [Pseudomonadota bacterium]